MSTPEKNAPEKTDLRTAALLLGGVAVVSLIMVYGRYVLYGLAAVAVLLAVKFVLLPILDSRAQTAQIRAEAKKIKRETRILTDYHKHNMEYVPAAFMISPDVYGNYPQMIGRDGRPLSLLLPGNAGQSSGTSGIPAKLALDTLRHTTVEADPRSVEEPTRQMTARGKILLSAQIEQGLTSADEKESVFGYPIDTYEPFSIPLFEKEGNFVNSLFVIGDQGQGKSTIGTYFAALTVFHGGQLLVIDPDADQEGQSLSSRLGPLARYLLAPIADTPEKAKHVLALAQNEIKSPGDYPLLLLVDEFSLIMREGQMGGEWGEVSSLVANTVENWATRGRKRRRRAVVFGQISNATRTGGTELRSSCAYVIFNTPRKKAELVLQDASDEQIAQLAPSLTPGVAIVSPAKSSETYIMQFPFPDERGLSIIADVRAEVDGLPNTEPRLRILPRPDRDSWDSGPVPGMPELRENGTVYGTSPEVPPVPTMGIDEPVEPVPARPAFVPIGEDKIIPEPLWDDLSYYYAKRNDVKAALHDMSLGNRYFRHASYILEERGLKVRKA